MEQVENAPDYLLLGAGDVPSTCPLAPKPHWCAVLSVVVACPRDRRDLCRRDAPPAQKRAPLMGSAFACRNPVAHVETENASHCDVRVEGVLAPPADRE